MSSHTCLYYHIILGTADRRPLITADLRPRLYEYIGGIIRSRDGKLITIGGVTDHVHLLVSLTSRDNMADLVRVVKTNSSKWTHDAFPAQRGFAWQAGYAAFTVSASGVPQVKQYIANQEAHHARTDFKEEYLAFLKRHGVSFDERHVLT